MDRIAFVGGATGYTGREVVRCLRDGGVRTYAHVRADSPRLPEWTDRFGRLGAEVDSTAWTEEAMVETFTRLRPTLVFALLGTTRARAREAEKEGGRSDYETVDYGMTRILLDASRSLTPPPRFVYLSALGAGSKAKNAYLAVRSRLESELRAAGLPFVIARPSFIVGTEHRDEARPFERAGATVVDLILRGLGALGATRMRDRYRSISPKELAEALVDLALDEHAGDHVFETDRLRRTRS